MLGIDKAINIINNRRNLAELSVHRLREKLREDKLFLELENKIGGISFEIAKREAQNKDLGDLMNVLLDLQTLYEKRLSELGYTQKDLEVKYNCDFCMDTGFAEGQKCSCLKNIIYDSLKSNCGRLETDIDDFNKLNYDIYDKETTASYKNTFKQLKKYTDNFPFPVPFLYLAGSTGVGKSFMASVVSNVLMKKGYSVLYLNACSLNQLFLNYHLAPIEKKEEIFSPLVDCDLLVIDDLGSEIIYNNVTVNYLYILMLQRYTKNTIITSNISSQKALEARYEQRISSRLMDVNNTIMIQISGNDLRFIKNKHF